MPLKNIMHNSHVHLMGLAVWNGDKSDGPLQSRSLFWQVEAEKAKNHHQLLH